MQHRQGRNRTADTGFQAVPRAVDLAVQVPISETLGRPKSGCIKRELLSDRGRGPMAVALQELLAVVGFAEVSNDLSRLLELAEIVHV